MFRSVLQRCAFSLASLTLLVASPATAQEGSAIGDLLLSIKTLDGRPVVGTAVVVKRQDQARAEVVGTTDATGTARVPAGTFEAEAPVRATVRAGFGTSSERTRDRILQRLEEEFEAAVNEFLISPPPTATPTITLPHRPGDEWALSVPFVALSDDPSVDCKDTGYTVTQGWASGCGSGDAVPWGEGSQYELEFDTGCNVEGPDGRGERVTGLVTGGYLFPVEPEEDMPQRDRDVDFFRPLILQFPEDLGRSRLTPPPGCADEFDERDLPDTSIFALHGYNIDFGDGSWDIRGVTALPVLDDYPLGIAAGIDFYPQTDRRSTTAFNLDLTYHLPWKALGNATAYGGGGLRVYRQSFTSTSSSSSTEIGFGVVSGMLYPIGPVVLYGDVGLDRIYGALAPVTRFGAGYTLRK